MTLIRNVLDRVAAKRIGGVFHPFEPVESRLAKLQDSLRRTLPIRDLALTQGWRALQTEFFAWITDQEMAIVHLARNADKHRREIQQLSDLIEASWALLRIIDGAVTEHEKTKEELAALREAMGHSAINRATKM